jgi:hypothetical protein
VLIGLNLFNGDAGAMKRQSAACDALLALEGVVPLNVQFEDGNDSCSDPRLTSLPWLASDSIQATGSNRGRKPIASEMFDTLAAAAQARGLRYFAYINSDIVVTRALVEHVQRRSKETYVVSRCDVGDRGGDRMITAGQDMFVVSVNWWQRNRSRFRPYILGEACWDNVYTAVMLCHSDGVLLNREPLILHDRHPAMWRDTTPEARYNGFLAALDARYFDLWAKYWHRLEAVRAAGGQHADEQRLARDVFVWKRSAPEALRQLVRSLLAHRRYCRLRTEWVAAG